MKALNELIEIFSDVDHSLLIKKSLHNKFIRSTLKKRFPKGLKSAAILLPIIDIEGSLEILLTKRSTHLTTHAGEICFPGGGSEKNDTDVSMTALRETKEEIGLKESDIKIIGKLPPVPTFTGYIIHPVVGILLGSPEILIDRSEVESYFTVPLTFFMNHKNKKEGLWETNDIQLPIVEYQYQNHRIWGATAMIISLFCDRLRGEVK
jgi:8-oxo-dGTP pyrophosphatase MutT (NUDIX family)